MNVRNTGHHITRRIRLIACISALATAFVVALPQVGHAQNVTPPPVPGTWYRSMEAKRFSSRTPSAARITCARHRVPAWPSC